LKDLQQYQQHLVKVDQNLLVLVNHQLYKNIDIQMLLRMLLQHHRPTYIQKKSNQVD
jgi:hypothetical protein